MAPEMVTLALLEREIWREFGSDWQLKLLASTVTWQLPVNDINKQLESVRERMNEIEFLGLGLGFVLTDWDRGRR